MKRALRGEIVTMDDAFSVIDDGVIYADGKLIVSVQPAAEPAPPGFGAVPVTATGGTVFPGLIELHNHLPYNVLELGRFTRKFTNRDQWRTGDYSSDVTRPLAVLNRDPELVAALIRYVESKSLFSGVTTSQGITLSANAGIQSLFKGLVRNVEEAGDVDLPDATTRIADLDAGQADEFALRLAAQKSALLLHLSEGTDEKSRIRFLRLQRPDGSWAINHALAGIHCVALSEEDWKIYGPRGGHTIWSPASNLLLYGETARIDLALEHGTAVALGADWSFSGSKNLLAELKVARAVCKARGWSVGARDLVSMVTRAPARVLRWKKLGQLRAGSYLDAIVLKRAAGSPYDTLIDATEADLSLVMIGGDALLGNTALMNALASAPLETVHVAGEARLLASQPEDSGVGVGSSSLASATAMLREAMQALPVLEGKPKVRRAGQPQVELVFDPDLDALPPEPTRAATPPKPLSPKSLDGLTVVDDPTYWPRFVAAGNLPAEIAALLPR